MSELAVRCDSFPVVFVSMTAACLGACGISSSHEADACDEGTACESVQASADAPCGVLCLASVCGNGVVESGEACDDGDALTNPCAAGDFSCTVCSADCQQVVRAASRCGDGHVDAHNGEECDDSNIATEPCVYGAQSCTVCDAECHVGAGSTSYCGDGVVDVFAFEQCDDGNRVTEVQCPTSAASCIVCSDACRTINIGGSHTSVILLIGDGMGFPLVDAASIYATGHQGQLVLQSLPYRAVSGLTTESLSGVTDSAAAATAIATGHKVANGLLSVASGRSLETILETAATATARSVGLVTTAFISDATPAAFATHLSSRSNYSEIVRQYLQEARPTVLFGGGQTITPEAATAAGYAVVQNREDLLAVLDSTPSPSAGFSGQFGESDMPYDDDVGELPHLWEMAEVALHVLSQDSDGFFLMVEAGNIDSACHNKDLARAVGEVLALDHTIDFIMSWMAKPGHENTLLLVVADHETGGLVLERNNGEGVLPDVSWTASWSAAYPHTNERVPAFGFGVGASGVATITDNTDVYGLMLDVIQVP